MNKNVVECENKPKIFCFNFDLVSVIEVLYIFVLILSVVGLVQKIRKSDFVDEK